MIKLIHTSISKPAIITWAVCFILLHIHPALGQNLPFKNAELSPEVRARDLVSRMSTSEKIGQLSTLFGWEMYDKPTNEKGEGDHLTGQIKVSEKLKKSIDSLHIGMLWGTLRADPWTKKTLQTGLNPAQAIEATNAIQKYAIHHSRWGIPLLLAEECAHGLMAIGSTVFPTSIGQASTWDEALIEKMSAAIARETRSLGSHIAYGPILDLAREPRWSRVEETYGEDPYLVAQMGLSFVRGLQGDADFASRADSANYHVLSTLKHFVAYGIPKGGHNGAAVSIGERELMTDYLPPFEKAIRRGGALSVMTAYNAIDGIPCTANKHLLTEVLKNKWGFQGFVVSDLGSISGLKSTHQVVDSDEGAAALALDGGVDSDLGGYGFGKHLSDALNSGKITTAQLDSAVFHCLRLKFRLGLFETPFRSLKDTVQISSAQHLQLNRQVAREAIVLLKKTNLPLKKTIRKLAVIGPNADNMYNQLGDYTAPQREQSVVTVHEGIRKKVSPATEVLYAKGCGIRDTNRAGIQKAVAIASEADAVIVVLGGSSARDFKTRYLNTGAATPGASSTISDMENGEGNDRSSLNLLGLQSQLLKKVIATGKPVILILINGRPIALNSVAQKAGDILEAWYPGAEGGIAIADVLFGDYNPSGRLPISIPKSVGQLPVYYDQLKPAPGKYVEMDGAPLYPFGFGLSYSTFRYSGMETRVEEQQMDFKVTINYTVTNTSSVAGTAIPQLYVIDDYSSVVTPIKKLCRFQRIYLRPGESRRLHFQLDKQDLKLLNGAHKWIVEPGTFTLQLGTSSKDIQSSKTINITKGYLME